MDTMTDKETTSASAGLVEGAKKAAYAAVGAPLVAGRRLGKMSCEWRTSAKREFEKWVTEGERMTADLRQGKVVGEIKEKVDFDHLQGRVEKLRDQLEDVLANWRATFKPEKPADTAAGEAAQKPAAAKKSAANAKTGTADKTA